MMTTKCAGENIHSQDPYCASSGTCLGSTASALACGYLDVITFGRPMIPRKNLHRSHFGSRYTSGCCDLAGLCTNRTNSENQRNIAYNSYKQKTHYALAPGANLSPTAHFGLSAKLEAQFGRNKQDTPLKAVNNWHRLDVSWR